MSKILFGLDPQSRSVFDQFNKNSESLAEDLKKNVQLGGEDARKAILNAFNIGAKATADSMVNSLAKVNKEIKKSQDDLIAKQEELAAYESETQQKINDELDENKRKALEGELTAKRALLASEIKKKKDFHERVFRKEMAAFEDQNRKNLKRIEENQKLIKEAHESSSKLLRERIQEGGESAGELISGALTLSMDDAAKSFTSLIGKGGMGVSRLAAAKLESRAAEGKSGGVAGAVLGGLTKIGPVLLGLTAAVSGLAAVFMAAYGQVKEFNKTILDAAPAVDLFGSKVFAEGFKIGESLKEIRDAAIEFSAITNVSAQEALGLITKFNDSGVALSQLRSEFSKTGSATEAYTEMAMFANTYTRALGISIDELTTHTGTMFTKLGMGMGSIAEGFSSITAGAQLAGLNVKDFFTAVSQTTSGLALYNIRLDKTAEQLLGLMKIMDRDKAKELLESKEMGGKGIEERFKAGMLVGGGGQKLFQAAMKSQMDNFTKDFGDKFTDTFSEFDLSKLGEMTGKQFGLMQQRMVKEGRDKGMDAQQVDMATQRMEKLRKVQIGAKGGTMGMAKGMSGLSGLADVAMRITEGMSLVGAQNLDDMGYIARKSFEDLSGISGENFDQIASLINRYQGQYQDNSIPEILEMMAAGKLPMTEADKALFDELSKTKPKTMEALAQEQVTAMTSVNDTLKNLIAGLLEDLGSLVTDIFDGLSNWPPFRGAKEKREQKLALKEEAKIAGEKSSNLAGPLKALKESLAEELAKPEYEQDESKIAEMGSLIDSMESQKAEAEKRKEIAEKTLEGMGKGYSTANARAEALGVGSTQVSGKGVVGLALEGMGTAIGIGGKPEALRTEEQVLKETEAAKEIAIKKASDDAIAQNKMIDFQKENEKQNLDIIKTLEEGQALIQLETQYGSAVGAAIGGDISFLKRAIGNDKAAKALAAKAGFPLQDFIYRGDGTRGTINPINKRDEFFGAKPGGAIDKAINGGGGGVVNIYISGDEAKVYNVVKRVIQESGLRAPAGGR